MRSVIFLHQGGELYGSDYIFYLVVKGASRICRPIVVLDSSGPLADRLRPLCFELHIASLGVVRRKHFNPRGVFSLLRQNIAAVRLIRHLAKRHDAGLIYSNTLAVTSGAIAARTMSLPHIAHAHEILLTPKLVGRALATFAKSLSGTVVAVSRPVKQFLDEYALSKRDNVLVIHNGIPTERFDREQPGYIRREFGIAEDVFLIAMVGRLHFWKGQEILLDAAAALKRRGCERFRVVFFGDVFPGYEDLRDKLADQVRRLQLEEWVVFAGYRNDAQRLFIDCDVVVVPSTLPDPLPTVVLEAMAAKKPVIASNQGGAPEMILPEITGFLVPPSDAKSLTDCMLTLELDPARRRRMGLLGRQRLETEFSEARFGERMRELFVINLHGKSA